MARSSQPRPIRTIFFGTPSFAVPILAALLADTAIELGLVVTRPDRPAGRGRNQASSPVQHAARSLGIETYQPTTLRDEAARQPLIRYRPDLFVVAAFGLVFGKKTLAIPRLGSVNVHGSLLPAYRGASPIAAAILNGDRETGASLMVMEPGLDTGPVIAQARVPIPPGATSETLAPAVSDAGALLVRDALARFADGELDAEPQPAHGATLTRLLTKADGWIDWSSPALELERHIRAMWPWPRAWTTIDGTALQVHNACVLQRGPAGVAGTVELLEQAFDVSTGAGVLRLLTVQPASRSPMPGAAFLSGRKTAPNERLGQSGGPAARRPFIVPVAAE